MLIIKENAVMVRNHIMFMVCIRTATQASNLINTTMEDFNAAKLNKEFDAYINKSNTYKTSMLYGDKVIFLGKYFYPHTKFYAEKLLPAVENTTTRLDDKARPLFPSSRKSGIMNLNLKNIFNTPRWRDTQ